MVTVLFAAFPIHALQVTFADLKADNSASVGTKFQVRFREETLLLQQETLIKPSLT